MQLLRSTMKTEITNPSCVRQSVKAGIKVKIFVMNYAGVCFHTSMKKIVNV